MPEGDTIHRLASRLSERLAGQQVLHYDAWEPALRRVDLVGQTLSGVDARGKHVLMRFSSGWTLNTHLQMEGRWVFRIGAVAAVAQGHLKIALGFDAGALLGYDVRFARFVRMDQLAAEDPLLRLGPDLLAADFDLPQAINRLAALGPMPIGAALLKQSALAGVGNVFKSEVLFLERINPLTPVNELARVQLEQLVERLVPLLRRNAIAYKYGDSQRRTRTAASAGPRLWVYRRAGEHCLRCDCTIRMVRQGSPPRSTYYCPECQRVEAA